MCNIDEKDDTGEPSRNILLGTGIFAQVKNIE